MNKIKCLEPLLSTFEAVFPSRRQPTATLVLLSSPGQRWLSPRDSMDEPLESKNWPFQTPVRNAAAGPPAATALTPLASETGQTGGQPQPSQPLSKAMPIRVAIVEDDLAVRENLAFLIGQSPQFNSVAACATAEAALQQLPEVKPDVVLMDIHLPGKSGIECVEQLRMLLPQTQVIMLTIEENPNRVFESLKAGATGYLVKHASTQEIFDAVAEVHRGGAPMSSQIARKVVTAFREPAPIDNTNAIADMRLSQREEQVLRQLAKGLRTKEIADELGISVPTVNTYVRKIYDKLHVRSRAAAVAKGAARYQSK